ncbi:MAG TPA: SRPBCC family protein [Pyrinomonadaceae bacterium]|jgi:uncharacterized membrane protein
MESSLENKSFTDNLTNTSKNLNSTERIVSAATGGALLTYGLIRRDMTGIALSIIGGVLALRGATGHCQVYDAFGIDTTDASLDLKHWISGKIEVSKSVTINQSPAALYAFWRSFENLPQFMNHLESVTKIDETRSHWIAKAPFGYSVQWSAEITDEQLNERIEWRSMDGADISNSGKVEFLPTADRGTEVRVTFTYEAPAGRLGALAARIFGEEPSQQVEDDLRRFKRLMEAGLIMKTEGQPSARDKQAQAVSV